MTDVFYDIFISHAFEDKNAIANQLAIGLKEKGLKIWYSGFELKLGDSIATEVNNALNRSRYAVVVISPAYIEKVWAMNELRALFAQETAQTRILPILHEITAAEIVKHLPLMADRYSISCGIGIESVIGKIVEVVTGQRNNGSSGDSKKKSTTENFTPGSGFITVGGSTSPNKKQQEALIEKSNWSVRIILIAIICLVLFFIANYIRKIVSDDNHRQPVVLSIP